MQVFVVLLYTLKKNKFEAFQSETGGGAFTFCL